ncbi:MAG: VCBS domain-containing protein [Bilophila sp.]
MADMTLTKPAAGAQDIVNAQPDARLLLDFPAGDATLERSGDDLIFHFDDGSNLVLRDFYTSYTRENMPDFVIDGTPVSGQEFFAALNNEDLMPAAGPATASNADGGRFREYADDPLQVGVDRLGGLDLGSNRAFYPERDPWGGLREDGSSPLPNREPIVNLTGNVGVIEAGVHPGGNIAYEGEAIATGRVTATDDDGDPLTYGFIDAAGNRVTTIDAAHGSITIEQDGTFTYTLDNNDPDTNGLALGETATETFTVFVDDGRGGVVTRPITVTITGTNDQPELTITGSGQDVVEDGTQSVTGTFDVADPDSDAGTDQTFHIDSANDGKGTDGTRGEDGSTNATFTTDYGTLTLNPETGEWEYTLNNDSDAVQQLEEGDTRTETFTITVTDEHGATSEQEITVTITGTNDAPVIESVNDLTLKETGVQDGGNTDTVPGENVTPSGDEHKLTATGKVTADDVDSDDDASSLDYKLQDADGKPVDTIETDYGTVHMDKDGTYTYELKDGAANHLAQGESVTETITVVVTDSHGATATKDVTVTIYGTNDKPTLSLDNTTLNVVESGVGRDSDGNVVENGTPEQENATYEGKLTAGGTATGTDVDNGASLTYGLGVEGEAQYAEEGPVTSAGEYGDLTINPDGSYTYTLRDGELDSLSEGEPRSETFTIYVKDEHGAWDAKEITVNITGTNDRPEITAADNLVLKETGVQDGGNEDTVPGETVTPSGDEHKLTATGKVTADDVDSDDDASSLDYKLQDADGKPVDTIETDYGTVHMGEDGTYTYELKDGAANHLAQGESVTETITVVVTDSHGATATKDVTVTIYGTNDKPTLSLDNTTLNVVESGVGRDEAGNVVVDGTPEQENATYEGKLTAGGTATGTDVDNGASLTYGLGVKGEAQYAEEGPVTSTGEYGDLTINPDGSYTYTLRDGELDSLSEGEPRSETFTIYVKDEHGAWDAKEITVNITGTNDRPEITAADNLVLKETGVQDGGNTGTVPGETVTPSGDEHKLTATGKVTADDVDSDDDASSLDYKLQDTDGKPVDTIETDYGTVHMDEDGTYTYELKDGAANHLAQGESVTETITVVVTDSHGATATKDVTVTIYGTNDKPTLSLDNTTLNVVESGVGRDEAGNVVVDGTPEQENATYEGKLTAGGTATGTDVDNGASLTYGLGVKGEAQYAEEGPVTSTGTYGDLTINPDGSYTYTLRDGELDSLSEGEPRSETFTIYVKDEHGAWDAKEITVNITGTNDRPEITAADNLVLKETGVQDGGNEDTVPGETVTPSGDEHKLTATGKVTADDVDSDDDASSLDYKLQDADGKPVDTIETDYGTVHMDEDGTYTYELKDGAANHLAQGESVTETITVVVTDSHGATATKDVTVTIYGTNDKPTLSLDNTTLEVVESGVGRDSDGNVVENGTPEQENATYEGKLTAGGTATGTDVDNGASLTYGLGVEGEAQYAEEGPVTSTGTYGDLTINPDGSYTYTLRDGELDSLSEGEPRSETFTIYVKDEHGAWDAKEITVNITGTNDRPEITAADNLVLKETGVQDGGNKDTLPGETVTPSGDEHKLTATGKVTADDVDSDNDASSLDYKFENGDSLSSTIETDYGTITIDDKGEYIYTLDNDAVHGLAQGETVTETITVVVTDRHGATDTQEITVTIYGTNDVPELKIENAEQHLTEDGDAASVSGTFEVIDPDSDAGTKQTFQIEGDKNTPGEGTEGTRTTEGGTSATFTTDYGTLTLDPVTGEWKYKLDNDSEAVQALKAGETKTETFNVTVVDEHKATSTQTITVTITGTNDTPTLTLTAPTLNVVESGVGRDEAGNIIEGGTREDENTPYLGKLTADGKAQGADVDHDASLTYGLGVDGTPQYADNGSVTAKGDYGTLVLNADGSYSYELSDDSTKVNALNEDQQVHDTFTVYVKDEYGAWTSKELTVTITGTNDAPVIESVDNLVLKETGVQDGGNKDTLPGETVTPSGNEHKLTATGKVTADDVDSDNDADTLDYKFENGDSLSSTITTDYGTIIIDAKGEYIYTLDNDAAHGLAQGEEVTETFTVVVTDRHGATDTQEITVTIYGTNDVPELKITDAVQHLTEDGDTPSVSGTFEVIDPDSDAGTAQTFQIKGVENEPNVEDTILKEGTQPTEGNSDGTPATFTTDYGTLTLDPVTGEWKYELDNDSEAVQSLAKGETKTETFKVTVFDEHEATSTQTITVTITGTNDTPTLTLSVPTLNVVESGVGRDEAGNIIEGGTRDLENSPYLGKLTADGKAQGADVDHDASLTYGLGVDGTPQYADNGSVTATTDYGTLVLNADGSYRYELKDKAPEVDALNEGQQVHDTFTIYVKDEYGAWTSQELTVTITGTNDAPVIESVDNLVLKETGVQDGGNEETVSGENVTPSGDEHKLTATGKVTADDVDSDNDADTLDYKFENGDSLSSTIETDYGTIIIDAKGNYTYTLDNDAAHGLAQGEEVTETFTVVVTDRHGATDTQRSPSPFTAPTTCRN